MDRKALEDEEKIIWLENPIKYRYLRESNTYCGTRTRKPPFNSKSVGDFYKLIGFSILSKKAKSEYGFFIRRVFWLKTYDDGCPEGYKVYEKSGFFPSEAVNPKYIEPKKPRSEMPRPLLKQKVVR